MREVLVLGCVFWCLHYFVYVVLDFSEDDVGDFDVDEEDEGERED